MKTNKYMNNQEIADLLRSVAAVYQIKNDSIFRIRAYENAAESIEHASREVFDIWQNGKLDNLSGIGKNISSHLNELFATGKAKHFNQIFKNVPESFFVFLKLPGIGAKKAYALSTSLKILSKKNCIEKLEKAAKNKKIRKLENFAEKSEKDILKAIEEYKNIENRLLYPKAIKIAEETINYMKKNSEVLEIYPLGSLRRKAATIGDIDIAVSTKNSLKVIQHFLKFPKIKKKLAAGNNTARVVHQNGAQIDLKTQVPSKFGALLQHFTGSKNHNIALRELAIKNHCSLSEYGIKKQGKIKSFKSEKDFYNALGLKFIPPELRENNGEIKAAHRNVLPKLVINSDIKGDLHLHTNYDWPSSHDMGNASVDKIVSKAKKLGYEYIGVGDHNPSISNNKEDIIISLIKERSIKIDKYISAYEKSNEKSNIKLLKTLEIDILIDGKLAIPNNAFNYLDYVVVSVHSNLRMQKREMTQRMIKGLKHPKAKILGHPTGRILNKRIGSEIDWDSLLRYMAINKKILEINAHPSRLDASELQIKQAISYGVKLAINSDAHSIEHMDNMKYGINIARRGWAQKKDIINCFKFDKINKILSEK